MLTCKIDDIGPMLRLILAGMILASVSGFAQSFDYESVLRDLKTLSSDEFEGRGMDTKGGEMTKAYIAQRLDSLGLQQFDSSWYQPFNVMHNMKLKKLHGDNVLGYIPGTEFSDRWIVVSSHHDHMGIMDEEIYNGADDNASGTCALFALAEHLRKNPPRHSVVLVAFDGEETGLIGSKHFVDNRPMGEDFIRLNMNMDMISRNDKNEIYLCGGSHAPGTFGLFVDADTWTDAKVMFGHDGSDKKDNWTFASDHANFQRAGIPFVYFGVEDHKDYHRPSDDFENIDQDFYEDVIELIIRCFEVVDKEDLE